MQQPLPFVWYVSNCLWVLSVTSKVCWKKLWGIVCYVLPITSLFLRCGSYMHTTQQDICGASQVGTCLCRCRTILNMVLEIQEAVPKWIFIIYSRVHKSSDSFFSKILEKPSIVQKKVILHIKGLDFSQRWSKKKIKKKLSN